MKLKSGPKGADDIDKHSGASTYVQVNVNQANTVTATQTAGDTTANTVIDAQATGGSATGGAGGAATSDGAATGGQGGAASGGSGTNNIDVDTSATGAVQTIDTPQTNSVNISLTNNF